MQRLRFALAPIFLLLACAPAWADTPDPVVETLVTQELLGKAIHKFAEVESALKAAPTTPCLTEGWDASAAPFLKPGAKIKGDAVFFVTHAATIWDEKATIRDAVNRRLVEANEKRIPTVYLVNTYDKAWLTQYYLKYRPSFLYYSEGGAHGLQLNVKNIYIAGGYFEFCAGETARDAFLLSDPKQTVRATYLTDSLYTNSVKYGTLKDSLRLLSDEQTLSYLQSYYFADGEVGRQNYDKRHARLNEFTFHIFRDGRKIGAIGTGAHQVEMNFVVDSEPAF